MSKSSKVSSKRKRNEALFAAAYLAPAVLVYLGLVIWPLLQAFKFSLFDWSGLSSEAKFVGLDNFRQLAQDDIFKRAAEHNLALLVIGGFVVVVLAVAVAHLMAGRGKTTALLRGVVLFPQMMSLTVVAILWLFIFNPTYGLFTGLLNAVGLGRWTMTWLANGHTALPAVGVAFAWYATGFYAMLFAAGLKSIPEEVNEAASLDGAVGFARFWKVTWPMLWSIKRIVAIHLTVTVLNVFVLVFLMTDGGPDRSSEVLLTYLYETAFKDSRMGYATTIAVANFVIAMALAAIILVLFRRDPTDARKLRGTA